MSRRSTLSAAVFAAAAAGALAGGSPARAAVGEGDELPQGARQEERLRKGLVAWKKVPDKIKNAEKPDEEWKNTQGFLRALYKLSDDMDYLSKGFLPDKKKKAEALIKNFQKRVKGADKPAKAKNLELFLVDHKDIAGMIDEFNGLLLDANENLDEPEEEFDVSVTTPK